MIITNISLNENYYQRTNQSCSPFTKRQIKKPVMTNKYPGKLGYNRPEWYEILLVNNKISYKIYPNYSIGGDTKKVKFGVYPDNLPGDPARNHSLCKIYLNELLQRLQNDIGHILKEAMHIRSVCSIMGYKINEYQAFIFLDQKRDFLNLLGGLIENDSPFKFDLIISCILQYSEKYKI